MSKTNNPNASEHDQHVVEAPSSNRKRRYKAPVLIEYGDVRDVTLGPTVGIGESGNELGRRPS